LTQEELQNIIEELEGKVSKDTATFGIYQYGGGADESFIEADKEGLMLFALELLKAARVSADILDDKEKSIIPIEFEEDWISDQSNTVIQYVKPVLARQPSQEQSNRKGTLADILLPVGCVAVLVLLVVAMLVGLWTLVKWIF
jgi:hypothetical protein